MKKKVVWTKEIIEEVVELRKESGVSFKEIAEYLENKYEISVTEDAVSGAYRRNKPKEVGSEAVEQDKETVADLYSKITNTQKRNTTQQKINKSLVKHILFQKEMLEALSSLIDQLNHDHIVPIKSANTNSEGRKMTIELLISDIQYGQQSRKADANVFRERLREVARATIFKVKQYQKMKYNVEKIVVAILGDIIESAHMHGHDSAVGCEFNTPEQMRIAVESLWYDLLFPLFQLGIPVHVPCVGGNHDRVEESMMTFETSKSCFSWPIYHGLKLLSEAAGYDHVTWDIAVGAFTTVDIYGHGVVYEHGYKLKPAEDELGKRLLSRMKQLGRPLTYFRMGDMHRVCRWGMDELVVNGSICGDNWYSEGKGFKANSAQMLFSYVERYDSKLPLFESFCIQLEWINKGAI